MHQEMVRQAEHDIHEILCRLELFGIGVDAIIVNRCDVCFHGVVQDYLEKVEVKLRG